MIKSVSFEEIIKVMRKALNEQSGVPLDKILNTLGVRGAELAKMISETEEMGIDNNDVFIMFNIEEDMNAKHTVLEEDERHMTSIAPFKFKLYIYGNGGYVVSQNILARFKSPEVAYDVRDRGVHIKDISYPISVNEYLNDTLWIRHDMEFSIEVKFTINKLTKLAYFEIPPIVYIKENK